ncbi:MAG TPA: O-antigen ligase family protein [Chitinophagaceae bacterium]|nr:O-antigen ligase family protein [Chitinophagaceae bacterium]
MNTPKILTLLGIGIAGSLVFWPVLNAFLGIVLFVAWLFFARKEFSAARLRWVLLFASLYLLVIVGYFYSANQGEALFKLQQKSALAMFPLVLGTAAGLNKNNAHAILLSFAWFTVLGCLFCLGYGTIHYISTGSTNMMHGYDMVVLKDMSPFMLALFCLLSFMYLLSRFYEGSFETGREKTIYTIVLLVLCGFLFLLGNRNVLFSWLVVLAFFFLKNLVGRTFRFVFFGVLLAAFALSAVFNPSFRRQLNDLTDFSENNTIQLDSDKSLGRSWGGKALRMAIWRCSADILEHYWLTGVGTGDAQDSLQVAYEKRQFYFASRYNVYNAHNQFIQQTIAHGIMGLLLFAACMFAPMFIARRKGQQLYLLFLVSFLCICFTESVLEISKGIVFYSFFNSIFAFLYGTKAN